MRPTLSDFDRPFGVDPVTLDLFSAEGAPSPAEAVPLWRAFQRPA